MLYLSKKGVRSKVLCALAVKDESDRVLLRFIGGIEKVPEEERNKVVFINDADHPVVTGVWAFAREVIGDQWLEKKIR